MERIRSTDLITLAPQAKRGGEREGTRRAAAGRVRGLFVSQAIGKKPLTLPMLRMGPLPLPAEAGRGQMEAE